MTNRRGMLKILAFVPGAMLVIHFASQQLSIDRCLDRGGVFDYAQGSCRFDVQTLPAVGYWTQYRAFIVLVLVLSAGIVVLSLRARNR